MKAMRAKVAWRSVIPVVAILTAGGHEAFAQGESTLLEIDADFDGEILEVRDGTGRAFTSAPFEGIEGFTYIGAEPLQLGKVYAAAARCCSVSSRWYSCLEADPGGKAWTIMIGEAGDVARVDSYVDGEWTEDVQPIGEGEVLDAARLEMLKSNAIVIVEKDGAKHGMLITPDLQSKTGQTIWFNDEEF